MDGTAEVWGELQPLQGTDRETRGALCQLSQDRPPHGLPQWVLCSPTAAGLFKCFFLVGQECAWASCFCYLGSFSGVHCSWGWNRSPRHVRPAHVFACVCICVSKGRSLLNRSKNTFSQKCSIWLRLMTWTIVSKKGFSWVPQRLCSSIHPFFSCHLYLDRVLGGGTKARIKPA